MGHAMAIPPAKGACYGACYGCSTPFYRTLYCSMLWHPYGWEGVGDDA